MTLNISAAALKDAELEEFIKKLVAAAPPLTPTQRDRIAAALRAGDAVKRESARARRCRGGAS